MAMFRKTLIAAAAIAALSTAIAASAALTKLAPPSNDILAMRTVAAPVINA